MQRRKELFMCEAKYDFLTVRDIQRTLKIGTNVAYNLIHSKAFPVIKIGKGYFFSIAVGIIPEIGVAGLYKDDRFKPDFAKQ